jgi:hypothetical protein
MPEPAATAPAVNLNFLLVLYELAGSAAGEQERKEALVEALRSFNGHQLTSSAWLLRTPWSPGHVLEFLRRLTPEDRLVVAEPARVGWCNIEDGYELFEGVVLSEAPPTHGHG